MRELQMRVFCFGKQDPIVCLNVGIGWARCSLVEFKNGFVLELPGLNLDTIIIVNSSIKHYIKEVI
jgi:hypothetical protein